MRQHKKFVELHEKDKRLAEHMERVGHFEFGAMRRLVNTGDSELAQKIEHLWNSDEEARGWGKYWASIYSHIADTINTPDLEGRCVVVRYEDLCADPTKNVDLLAERCELEGLTDSASDIISTISLPSYYESSLSQHEIEAIWDETAATASRFGYARDSS